MDKPGHEICAQKKMDVSSFMGQRNASQGLALWKSSIGTPERCPLDLCRSVCTPTVTGASINEVLAHRLKILPHSVKMLPHRVQILARCVQILAHFVHIVAHCPQ